MIPDRSEIAWYDMRQSTHEIMRLSKLDAIRISHEWCYVAYQPDGPIEVYVNGVKVLSTRNMITAKNLMEDYLEGRRRLP